MMLKMYTRTIVAVPNAFFLFIISTAICAIIKTMKSDSMIDVMIFSANMAIPPAYNKLNFQSVLFFRIHLEFLPL